MENVSIVYSAFDGVNKLSGINKKIRDSGLNIEKMIETSSSPVYNSQFPSNTLYESNGLFTTESEGIFITYHFVGRKIYLEKYSILTVVSNVYTDHHPSNWIVHGSNDNETWKMIDVQHTSVLNARNKSVTFRCRRPRACSYIRIKNIGPNYVGYNVLRFQQIEFFGTLFPDNYNFFPEQKFFTHHRKIESCPRNSIFLVMLLNS